MSNQKDNTESTEAAAEPAVENIKVVKSPLGAAVARGENGELYGVLAEYDTPGELIAAARKVRDAGYTQFDCYSPFPVHGIDEAMGIKRTILPLLVLGGGLAGLFLGGLLQWWTNAHNWAWNISGKPAWSIPANIPIAFETTILLSVFTTFFGMWILNRLPQVWHPFFRLDRFARATDDAFLLGIEAKDARFDLQTTTKLLEGAGAIAVEPCHLDGNPASKQMPKFVFGVILATTVLALIPFAIIAKARASKSSVPHYHVFSDMDFQEKVKSDTAFDMFADGRGNRGTVGGTVSRGNMNSDNAFYCAPCHGYDGQGKGAVKQRADKAGAGAINPANLVGSDQAAVLEPNGQLFNTISNGYNTMMGYSAQIPVADRWAIVLYVRALQRATNATLEDVPADRRGESR
jgi:Protein of unknown function (DUF3341)/Cytochrome C oxidase, cbb3-type, subunit III